MSVRDIICSFSSMRSPTATTLTPAAMDTARVSGAEHARDLSAFLQRNKVEKLILLGPDRVLAGLEHPREVVDRCVRVTGPEALDQRGDHVEVILAIPIVEQHALARVGRRERQGRGLAQLGVTTCQGFLQYGHGGARLLEPELGKLQIGRAEVNAERFRVAALAKDGETWKVVADGSVWSNTFEMA